MASVHYLAGGRIYDIMEMCTLGCYVPSASYIRTNRRIYEPTNLAFLVVCKIVIWYTMGLCPHDPPSGAAPLAPLLWHQWAYSMATGPDDGSDMYDVIIYDFMWWNTVICDVWIVALFLLYVICVRDDFNILIYFWKPFEVGIYVPLIYHTLPSHCWTCHFEVPINWH